MAYANLFSFLVCSMGKRRAVDPPSGKPSSPVPVAPAATSNLSLWTIAPMLAVLASGLQFMAGAWAIWLERPIQPVEVEQLTATGRIGFRPDYDMRIYVLGIAATLALAVAASLVWRRRLGAVQGNDRLAWARFLSSIHLPAAAAIAVVPMLWTAGPQLNIASGCLGLLFCATALWMAGREPATVPRWLRWPKPVCRGVEAALVIAMVVLLVYIPDRVQVSAWLYQLDRFHHWDFYMVAPALAYRHGMALGTDFYTQYGVGWPVLLAWLSHFTPLSYKLAIQVGIIWGCVYFSAVFFFLRLFLRSTAWALAGLLLVLFVQLFSATDLPKWVYPSSTALRYSSDIFLFAACLMYARSGKAWLGLLVGLFAALGLLFATDVGVYMLVCLVFFLVALQRMPTGTFQPRQAKGFILCVALSFAVVLLLGLAIASRGTINRAEFWIGWTESLRLYADGHGHLPIGGATKDRDAYALLILMLFCYFFAVGRTLEAMYKKTLSPEGLLVGMISLYGLATFTWFIGRSHPWNMHHAAIPFCMVLTIYLASMYAAALKNAGKLLPAQRHPLLHWSLGLLPSACVCLVLIALLVSPAFQTYPNLLRWTLQDRFLEPKIPDGCYLFASRRDAPLPDQFQPEIAKFRTVADTLRELSENGRNRVAMIDYADTHFLVEADLCPYFRYSPVLANMLYWKQVDLVEQQIINDPPDYLLFPSEAPLSLYRSPLTDVYESLKKTIGGRFIFDRRVYDVDVYHRRPQIEPAK